MSAGLATGMGSIDTAPTTPCETCIQGKAHQKAISSTPVPRSTTPLERVHSDICGPMHCTSNGGALHFATFVDDYTHYGWVYFLKSKSDFFQISQAWHKQVTTLTGHTLKILHSDNGGEYISNRFRKFIASISVTQEHSAHTPQHNGVAERRNRTLVELARCMLHHAALPDAFWAEVVSYANLISNYSPSKAVTNSTPFELFKGAKPTVKHFRVFGCSAHALTQGTDLGKFKPRTKEMIYLGPSEHSGHQLWDPRISQVLINRNVHFLEAKRPSTIISMTNMHGNSAPYLPMFNAGPDTTIELSIAPLQVTAAPSAPVASSPCCCPGCPFQTIPSVVPSTQACRPQSLY
jgi:Integrase core domain